MEIFLVSIRFIIRPGRDRWQSLLPRLGLRILLLRSCKHNSMEATLEATMVFIARLFSSAASCRVAAMCLTMWTYNTWALMLLDA